MKITIISGSHRKNSQSEKIARHIQENLGAEAFLFLLAENPLPLWDEAIWNNDETWNNRLAPLKKELTESDAFIIIAPEYHGQAPAGLKNFFLMFNRFELGHKPAMIIGVSSSTGGAYPIAELRMSSYKNNRLCYIPEQMIIRDVEKVFNENPADNDAESDTYYKERLNWSMDILKGYATALKGMRENTKIHHDDFSNGM